MIKTTIVNPNTAERSWKNLATALRRGDLLMTSAVPACCGTCPASDSSIVSCACVFVMANVFLLALN